MVRFELCIVYVCENMSEKEHVRVCEWVRERESEEEKNA